MEENIVVPEKFILNNTKVHRIEGYDEIRSNAKLAKKKQEFINETNKVLSLFDIDAKKYDYKLVLAIMQSAEDFFGKRKLGDTKKECVIECIKKFFNNDILLCERIIDMVFPNLIQTSQYRRIKIAIICFFSSVLQIMQAK